MDQKLLYELKILKQLVYKLKNQLGKTVQYRKMMEVYKCLKKYMSGYYIEDFLGIVENASISVIDSISKKFLVPVFTVLLASYARIYNRIINNKKPVKSIITSRNLKKIIKISKMLKSYNRQAQKNEFNKLENFLEKIRINLK